MVKKNFKSIVRLSTGIIFFLVLIVYGYFRAYTLIHGGTLSVNGIIDGEKTETSFVVLRGETTHAKELMVNGRTIATDEHGNFSDQLILLPGYNVITVAVRDAFGHRSQTVLHSYYEPNNAPSVALAQ